MGLRPYGVTAAHSPNPISEMPVPIGSVGRPGNSGPGPTAIEMLSALKNQIGELHDAMSGLEQKLVPILTPPGPDGAGPEGTTPVCSLVTTDLIGLTGWLSEAARYTRHLTTRVEL